MVSSRIFVAQMPTVDRREQQNNKRSLSESNESLICQNDLFSYVLKKGSEVIGRKKIKKLKNSF
jgi:hypothetical protein